MTSYRVIALPTEVATEVRLSHKSPRYNHPTQIAVAKGHGPCRHCLRSFAVGKEQRTLFTYDSFAGVQHSGFEPVPLPGPVFIHTETCERYAETAGYPQDLLAHAAVLNAYGKEQTLLTRLLVEANGEHEAAVAELLDISAVDYIEVRDRKAGCLDFRIER